PLPSRLFDTTIDPTGHPAAPAGLVVAATATDPARSAATPTPATRAVTRRVTSTEPLPVPGIEGPCGRYPRCRPVSEGGSAEIGREAWTVAERIRADARCDVTPILDAAHAE